MNPMLLTLGHNFLLSKCQERQWFLSQFLEYDCSVLEGYMLIHRDLIQEHLTYNAMGKDEPSVTFYTFETFCHYLRHRINLSSS